MARLSRSPVRRGSTLIESTLMIPLLLTLIFGGIEFGSLLHMRHTMLNAARDAARVLAVQGGTYSEAYQAAHDALPNNDLTFNVEITAPAPDDVNRDVTVKICLPYADVTVGDTFGLYGDGDLVVTATMRSEQ